MLIDFREKGREGGGRESEREREREKERETSTDCLLLLHVLTWD